MRLLVILLIILILLFVVLVVWGAGKSGSRTHDSRAEADQFNRDRDSGHHSTMDSFGGMFSRFGPKLKPESLSPSTKVFTFADRNTYTISILGDSDHQFRQAKFVVTPAACAHAKYAAFDSQDADENLRNQDSNDIKNKKPPGEFTLTILEKGGTLLVERSPLPAPGVTPGACRVEIK